MNIDDPDINDLARPPSEGARKFGIIAALFVCTIFGLFPIAGIYIAHRDGIESLSDHLGVFVVTTILFVLLLVLLYRIAFGKAQKLSANQILGIGYTIGVASCFMAVAAIFSEKNSVHMTAMSLVGIASSMKAVHYGRNKRNDS